MGPTYISGNRLDFPMVQALSYNIGHSRHRRKKLAHMLALSETSGRRHSARHVVLSVLIPM